MRTKIFVVVVLALALVSLIGAPAFTSDATPPTTGMLDRQEACSSFDTLAPEHHEVPVVGDWSTEVVLDVHVLTVQFSDESAAAVMEHVADVYEPLGIKINAIIEPVALQIDPPEDAAGGVLPNSSHSGAYIQASKDYFDGERPWWADVVYTMLGGELASTVAGQADCVGGIAYPHEAFAVGEAEDVNDYTIRRTAKIAAHEIAHLLAAHHHYANCAEGNKEEVTDLKPCTLMFNDVGLISLAFGTLEGAVVRRWALDYANATPTTAPPPPQPVVRSVILEQRQEGVATGTVSDGGAEGDGCTAKVPVILQRKTKKKGWKETAFDLSDEASAFSFEVTAKGVYRAVATATQAPDETFCPRGISDKLYVH